MFNSKKKYIYPKVWNDDDIIKFKYYLKEAKEMYGELPDNIIELCVEQQINEEKGLVNPIDYSQIKDLKIDTPYFQEFRTEIIDNNKIEINV